MEWMTEFNMKVIHIFLARGSSRLHPLVIGFSKIFISGYPAFLSLELVIKDDVAIHRLDHDVVLMVT